MPPLANGCKPSQTTAALSGGVGETVLRGHTNRYFRLPLLKPSVFTGRNLHAGFKKAAEIVRVAEAEIFRHFGNASGAVRQHALGRRKLLAVNIA